MPARRRARRLWSRVPRGRREETRLAEPAVPAARRQGALEGKRGPSLLGAAAPAQRGGSGRAHAAARAGPARECGARAQRGTPPGRSQVPPRAPPRTLPRAPPPPGRRAGPAAPAPLGAGPGLTAPAPRPQRPGPPAGAAPETGFAGPPLRRGGGHGAAPVPAVVGPAPFPPVAADVRPRGPRSRRVQPLEKMNSSSGALASGAGLAGLLERLVLSLKVIWSLLLLSTTEASICLFFS
ncbi:basic proline-rich protein-like [Poecile atricapillus]|uniref:basic proline-rich protein-like n=1 Tax=Poecile atricapillus TaxID=48891 RepID=UPI0027382E2A|nr:basic proline-rich protein-like [Poecile atricapillus]